MSGLPRFLCVAFAAAAVVACGKVQPIASPDAHVDAQFELPDAHPAKGPCDAPVALEDFANCVDQEYCTKLAECGFGSFGDTNCKDLPIELLSGINGPAFATAVQGSIDGGRGAYDPDAAGQCLAMLTRTRGRPVVLVLMDAGSVSTRSRDARKLRHWASRQLRKAQPARNEKPAGT